MNLIQVQYDNADFFAAYAQMARSQFGLDAAGEWYQLEPMFPELGQKTVLDLGCGYGWHCKYVAEKGASRVLGIDQSEKMINEAIKRNSAETIEYRVCSLNDFDYPEDSFDVVISNLVFHYIDNLQEAYSNVHKTMKAGGVFLLNIEPPTFTAGVKQQFAPTGIWPVTDYFYPGKRSTDFLGYELQKYHHTLTQILNGLLSAGFQIEAVEEVIPPEEWRVKMPEEMLRPMMLLVKAVKPRYDAKRVYQKDMECVFSSFYEAIANGENERARNLLEKLVQELGENNADVVGATTAFTLETMK